MIQIPTDLSLTFPIYYNCGLISSIRFDWLTSVSVDVTLYLCDLTYTYWWLRLWSIPWYQTISVDLIWHIGKELDMIWLDQIWKVLYMIWLDHKVGPNPSLSKPYPICCKCATLSFFWHKCITFSFLAQMLIFMKTSTKEMIAINCFELISKGDL